MPDTALPPRASTVRAGVVAGLVASGATAGALVTFGLRQGTGAAEPFRLVGRRLLGVASAEGGGAQLLALAAGVLLHMAVVIAWALLFALAARALGALRGARLALLALLFGAVAYGADRRLLPALLQLGYGARALTPQLLFLHAVLSVALALGIRLAFSGGDALGAEPR